MEKTETKNNFLNLKESILKALQPIAEGKLPKSEKGYVLIDGFFNFPIQQSFGDTSPIKPSFPCVCIVDKSSGIATYVSVAVLLPEVDISDFG